VRVLFDTSVLVAGIVEAHPLHDRSLPWLKKAKGGNLEYLVGAHSLAELYAVLSALPTSPRIGPRLAWQLVRENVEAHARVISLSGKDYAGTIGTLADREMPGGIVYDALIVKAAQKAHAEKLLTLNPKDFLRVWPEGAGVIASP